MRFVTAIAIFLSLTGLAAAMPEDDFADGLKGPWGRVDSNWQPFAGALSKNSCPPNGVKRKESIGLFGDGGTMWIEPALGGALHVHDGGPLPKLYTFVRMDGMTAAIYREGSVERRIALLAADRMTHANLPGNAGLPAHNLVRCQIKK